MTGYHCDKLIKHEQMFHLRIANNTSKYGIKLNVILPHCRSAECRGAKK
jgi:hypothetical protein